MRSIERSSQGQPQSASSSWFALGAGLLGTTLVCCSGALGCSDGVVHSSCGWLNDEHQRLIVATWWNAPEYSSGAFTHFGLEVKSDAGTSAGSGAELDAARKLNEGQQWCENDPIILQKVPNYWVKQQDGTYTEVADKEALLTYLEQRVEPPSDNTEKLPSADLAIINFGADLERLVCKKIPEHAALESLGHFDDPELRFLAERIPAFLRKFVTCPGGNLYGAVLGLHRLNTMLFNKRALGSDALDSDRDIVAGRTMLQLAQYAREQSGLERPMVVVDQDWAWSLLVMENIMVAAVGRDRYLDFWRHLTPPDRGDEVPPEVVHSVAAGETTVSGIQEWRLDMKPLEEALDTAIRLAQYMQTVETSMEAIDAISGTNSEAMGAITVMGDWVVPDAHLDVVGSTFFPGTEQSFVFIGDMISVPKRAGAFSSDDPAIGLIKEATSPKVQSFYSQAKHSRPVVKSKDGREVAMTEEEIFRDEDGNSLQGVPGLPAFIPYGYFKDMETEIQTLMLMAINISSDGRIPESSHAMQAKKDELLNYVQHEFCGVWNSRNFFPQDCPRRIREIK